jgi:beta-galactosidase
MTAYDVHEGKRSEETEQWWQFYATRDFLPGGFAWTGFDYRGEPTPYGWPSISSQFGILDTCGYPKDCYWYYKSWWGADPVLHLFPHWNWDQRFGEPVPVWVHSNADEVELFLNGKSQGSRKVVPLSHLEWSVKYEPGVIEARASKDGKVILVERRETTGRAETLRLTCDRPEIDADGEDLVFVRVEALDGQGRVVPTASDHVHFKITGAGTLIGVGNGDPNCQESDKEPMRSLFNGLAQAILQSTKTPGDIVVEAHTEDWLDPTLPSTTLTIRTRKVPLRPRM